MDNEQLEKRIEWLDEERGKDKKTITDLEKRLLALEGKLDAMHKKNQELDSGLTRLRTAVTRVDDLEEDLGSFRVDRKKEIKEQDKLHKSWIEDAKKSLQAQIRGLETHQKKVLDDFKRVSQLEMQVRSEEETRFNAAIRELEGSFVDIEDGFKEIKNDAKNIKIERQKDVKRTGDLQGEIAAIRKRLDEMRGSLDLLKNDYQKAKTRIQELESSRRELKKEQEDFLEEVSLGQTERQTTWKNWMTRFDLIEIQAKALDEQMTKLDSTHRGVKRMQEKLTDVSDLLDRRVNEITEMQRLADEKFRTEWNTFMADDQKRWTNFSLSQKERSKLLERDVKESENRISTLEDGIQELEDQLTQISKYSENQLQSLLSLMRDWAGDFEQIMDGFR